MLRSACDLVIETKVRLGHVEGGDAVRAARDRTRRGKARSARRASCVPGHGAKVVVVRLVAAVARLRPGEADRRSSFGSTWRRDDSSCTSVPSSLTCFLWLMRIVIRCGGKMTELGPLSGSGAPEGAKGRDGNSRRGDMSVTGAALASEEPCRVRRPPRRGTRRRAPYDRTARRRPSMSRREHAHAAR